MKTMFKLTAVVLLVLFPFMPIKGGLSRPVSGYLVGVNGLSSNWTGYGVDSSDNGNNYFTQVEATWTVHEPISVISGSEVLSEITTWVGLGGDVGTEPKSSVLWQAGTTHWNNGYQFWYEDIGCTQPCPENGYPVSVSYPSISYGDKVKVAVKLDGEAVFENLTTGHSKTYLVDIDNNNVGLSAEWISELTCTSVLQAQCVPVKFNSAHFNDAYAYGTKLSTYFDLMNYQRFDLGNEFNHVIAVPTKPRNHGFNVACCIK